jgi:hypothetical protein
MASAQARIVLHILTAVNLPSTAELLDGGRGVTAWVGRSLVQIARVLFGVGLLVLAQRVLVGAVDSKEALAVAGLALAAVAAFALSPRVARRLADRVSKISVGPVALEVVEAARQAPSTKGLDDSERDERQVRSVLDLRLKIERKLAYVAKHLLDTDGNPTFLTVGSLKYDKLLPDSEADVVNQLMTLRDEDLNELPPLARDRFFAGADKIARSIRASVLFCFVSKELREATGEGMPLHGWEITEIARREDQRPDLLAGKEGTKLRIASVFATDVDSKIFEAARKRLAPGGEDRRDEYARTVIVLPHRSERPLDPAGDPVVVTTDQLVAKVAELG